MYGNKGDINSLKEYADINDVPIMQDEGIDFLIDFILKNNINSVLEIGSAIGYSAIMMAIANPSLKITTIERDQSRYLEALKNIKAFDLEDRVTLVFNDALDANIEGMFDLIFIDAAKGQNIKFFEKYELNLNDGGYIITDNMNFHGLVDKEPEEIESRNLRQLIRKINEYRDYLSTRDDYDIEVYNVGDGIAVARKKEIEE
ncbi:MAG: O-methyltransferase [Bacilli bacterium]|nr:O-methyltransferase [Bacilli bacterium]